MDWRPFEYATTEDSGVIPGVRNLFTYRLIPLEGETRLEILAGRSQGPLLMRLVSDLMLRQVGRGGIQKGGRMLRERIEEDVAAGRVVAQPLSANPAPDTEKAPT